MQDAQFLNEWPPKDIQGLSTLANARLAHSTRRDDPFRRYPSYRQNASNKRQLIISLGMSASLMDAKKAEGAAFRLRGVVSVPNRTESDDIGVDSAYSTNFSIHFESPVASTWFNLRLSAERKLG